MFRDIAVGGEVTVEVNDAGEVNDIFDMRRAHRCIVVPRLKQVERKKYVRHALNFSRPVVLNFISRQCLEHRSPAIS